MKTKLARQSNFELLRVIAMCLIILGHYGQAISQSTVPMTRLCRYLIEFGCAHGQMAANCFILITGYFMVGREKIKPSSVVKLVLTVILYSWGIAAIFYVCHLPMEGMDGISGYLQILFPVSCRHWWFISAYVGLYILIPYINRMIEHIDKTEFQRLLLILFLMMSVIPTFTVSDTWVSDLAWVITLYSMGAYLKKFSEDTKRYSTVTFGVLALLGMIVLGGSVILLNQFPSICQKLGGDGYFRSINKLPTALTSVFVFLWFSRIKIGNRAWINTLGKATFGVYLIHMHLLVESLLWKPFVARPWMYGNVRYVLLSVILVPIGILLVCSVIEIVRVKLFDFIERRIARKSQS